MARRQVPGTGPEQEQESESESESEPEPLRPEVLELFGPKVLRSKVLWPKVLWLKVLWLKVLCLKVLWPKVLWPKVLWPKVLWPKVLWSKVLWLKVLGPKVSGCGRRRHGQGGASQCDLRVPLAVSLPPVRRKNRRLLPAARRLPSVLRPKDVPLFGLGQPSSFRGG